MCGGACAPKLSLVVSAFLKRSEGSRIITFLLARAWVSILSVSLVVTKNTIRVDSCSQRLMLDVASAGAADVTIGGAAWTCVRFV